jgi:hypothetical protein
MRPSLQERFQVYVMGPNQDARLAVVTAGQAIRGIHLKLDLDAPFVLRARALRQTFVTLTQAGLQFLKTQWTGPDQDYRQGDFILESLQQPYYGQNGCPKPVSPEIIYPAGGIISLDLINTGPGELDGLTFYWIGVNLYPWGVCPAPSYPAQFRGLTFAQPFLSNPLAAPEILLNQPFRAKSDGDLVIRAGQAAQISPDAGPGPS